MDFSACVISKGLGPAPVKLGDSSFSARLQIKQSCLAKQNPLQSYFPPSVWPDKIQGNHFNPEAFPDQETLDQSDWWKGPINTMSKPFLKSSTSSVGGKWKASPNLAPLPAGELLHTLRTPPSCADKTPWTENIYFSTSLLFLPTVSVRHPSLSSTASWVPKLVQVLSRHFPSHWCCVHLWPGIPESFSCYPAGLLSFWVSAARHLSARGGCSHRAAGPHGGTRLNYPLSKSTEEDHKNTQDQLLGWKPNTSWALWDQAAQESHGLRPPRPHHLQNTTAVLGCLSSALRLLGDESQNISRSQDGIN